MERLHLFFLAIVALLEPKLVSSQATLHDSSHASAIDLRIVGRQYASPGENSTFSATLVAVDAVAIEWFVDGRWRANESLSHSNTSLFRHRWASHARVGLHNVTTRVVAEDGTLLESRPIWIAVTYAFVGFHSTSPSLPHCATDVSMFTHNVSSGFDDAEIFIYSWRVEDKGIEIAETSPGMPANVTLAPIPSDGFYAFHVNVSVKVNESRYFLTSGNITIEISDQPVVSVDVTPVGYIAPGFSLLCSTCCTIIGSYVTFSATVYNPKKCMKLITYTWHFDGGSPSDPWPSLSPSAQPLYLASGNFAYSLTVKAGLLGQYSSQVNGTVCIEDPVKGLTISAPKQVQKNKEFNITVSCKGSHPISYCYITCQHEKEKCTESTKEENVSIPLRFEKSGNCFINITARNNASHADGHHPIVIQNTNNVPKTVSYTVPAVVGTVICVILVVFLAGFYHQYKAYRRRHVEVADFDYLGRKEPPSRWLRLKLSLLKLFGIYDRRQKREHIQLGYGSMSS